MILECIVENEKDAIKAEQLGFNRLELVSAMSEGGLTPSYGTIKRVIENVKIPVQVMLRPHSYSFEYDEFDWMSMKEELQAFSDLGVQGIVFGCLRNGKIDQDLLEKVIKEVPHFDITFHRAFDELKSYVEGLEVLCQYSQHVKRILTSGGESRAYEGRETLQQLITLSDGWSGPEILIGGGLDKEHIQELHSFLNAKEYHFGSGVRKDRSFANGFDTEKIEYLLELFESKCRRNTTL
ncbi:MULTISPECIES: copper homeostasis protein CutC [unclassified Bacillus (in: firmicutes)]|uniref:copper homeostasis protein CutC n=1 Tax=unclassified Bacillus (in: firmicutes) TaxID=185979 RepID=UPI00080ADB48|nr:MULTISPECIES: copper homeostasis protein CutC [unclassified Bacillus (in: firmicutes)]OCA90029.1 copper homeostasis protein CutC [Bacillus sp. FJAT-27986]